MLPSELNCPILRDSHTGLPQTGNKDLHNFCVCKVTGIATGTLQRFKRINYGFVDQEI